MDPFIVRIEQSMGSKSHVGASFAAEWSVDPFSVSPVPLFDLRNVTNITNKLTGAVSPRTFYTVSLVELWK